MSGTRQPDHLDELPITIDAVVSIVENVLSRRASAPPPVAPGSRLDELGLESLEIAEIFALVEDGIGFELDPAAGNGVEIVADILRLRPMAGDASPQARCRS